MAAPSIEQAIPSSTNSVAPAATERSGNAHIVPLTWHKVNKHTSAKYCVLTRRIKKPSMLMQNLRNFDA
jgi:hypothetical protein